MAADNFFMSAKTFHLLKIKLCEFSLILMSLKLRVEQYRIQLSGITDKTSLEGFLFCCNALYAQIAEASDKAINTPKIIFLMSGKYSLKVSTAILLQSKCR